MRRTIYYRVECDFCFEVNQADLYFVEVSEDIQTYTACMQCIEQKGWKE